MIQIVCDGCGNVVKENKVALTGRRSNGLGGGGMPDGEFHLCEDCGYKAFHTLPKWSDPRFILQSTRVAW